MSTGLRFGLFPLGLAGGPGGVASGPADAFERIAQAVQRLEGAGEANLTSVPAAADGAFPGATDAFVEG